MRIEIGGPVEDARFGVEEGTGRQEIAGERQGIILRIARQNGNMNRLAFQHRTVGWPDEGRRLIHMSNEQSRSLGLHVQAVADEETNVGVGTHLACGRCPGQGLLADVKYGARRKVVRPVDERVILRVRGVHANLELIAFLSLEAGGQRVEHWRTVASVDGNGELLLGVGTAGVVDLHGHVDLRRAARGWRPGDQAGYRVDAHTGRAAVEQIAQARFERIMGQYRVLIRLSRVRRGHRLRVDDRRHIGRRHDEHAGLEREPQSRRIIEGDRFQGRCLAREKMRARERLAQVDPPGARIGLNVRSLDLRHVGIHAPDVQDQRRHQVVAGVVGQRDIIGIGLGDAVAPAVDKVDAHQGAEITDGFEIAAIGLGQLQPIGAFHVGADLQDVVVRVKRVENQQGGPARRIKGN